MQRANSAPSLADDLLPDEAHSQLASARAPKITRATTVDLVLEAIRGKILRGEIGSGEALRQEALADELGVSRVPIREAITRLHGEGLVTLIPHKGAYVCGISADEVRESFEIRLRLEPWIFGAAMVEILEPLLDTVSVMGAARVILPLQVLLLLGVDRVKSLFQTMALV